MTMLVGTTRISRGINNLSNRVMGHSGDDASFMGMNGRQFAMTTIHGVVLQGTHAAGQYLQGHNTTFMNVPIENSYLNFTEAYSAMKLAEASRLEGGKPIETPDYKYLIAAYDKEYQKPANTVMLRKVAMQYAHLQTPIAEVMKDLSQGKGRLEEIAANAHPEIHALAEGRAISDDAVQPSEAKKHETTAAKTQKSDGIQAILNAGPRSTQSRALRSPQQGQGAERFINQAAENAVTLRN